jgi:hypothetical protein
VGQFEDREPEEGDMADEDAARRRGYPYMSPPVWLEIRNRFRKSMPKQVNADYLQSILGISTKAARNLVPQLKAVGLIDENLAPTDLANDFRDDQGYAGACEQILTRVYPDGLLDAHPDPGDDLDGVANWFMRNAGTGEAAARTQARFLAMIASKVPPEAGERTERKPAKATAPIKKAAPIKGEPKVQHQSDQTDRQTGDAHGSAGPAIHLDIQIHIAADAGPDQIDAIFASMARHLYDRK